MRCDIVMATWNAVPMTRTALESLKREANFPYRLILVDNSNEDEARAWFRAIADSGEFGETLLIQNESNIGWLQATNRGLEQVDADYVCLLNNDVICGSDWLRRCIALMQRHPEIGLVNPRGNERSENVRVKDVNAYAQQLAAIEDGRHTELAHCSGFCMVMPARLLGEIGRLDEIFANGYYEDNDFSYRARAAGYLCAQCDDAFVLHLGSQSFKKMPVAEKRAMIARNREICRQRWGDVRTQLLWLRQADVSVDDLLALIRQHRIYLIDSVNVPAAVRSFRHQNLRLLRPAPFGAGLTFLWQSVYLGSKKRIDEARILYA